ncbi:MAG: hypothetical protein ACLFTU_07445, partial [Puniceicoccaceae bacterium]
ARFYFPADKHGRRFSYFRPKERGEIGVVASSVPALALHRRVFGFINALRNKSAESTEKIVREYVL